MRELLRDALEENPIIAAVKNTEDLQVCCSLEDIKVVFILFGDICSIADIVHRVKSAGKVAVVHIDLIGGLGSKEVAVDFVQKNTMADGIITTKLSLIKRGRELGICTIQRCFLLDSMAYENIRQQQRSVQPDFIEVLPGLMPKVIRKMCQISRVPIIAGGLISDKESVIEALSAGAAAISSTNHEVWRL